jgi:hypothetical protein
MAAGSWTDVAGIVGNIRVAQKRAMTQRPLFGMSVRLVPHVRGVPNAALSVNEKQIRAHRCLPERG